MIVQHQFAIKVYKELDYGRHSAGLERDQSGMAFHRCTETTPCLHVITPYWGAPSYLYWINY
jgi:hypothetical protein